jgi:DNA-binding NarL/FixJ family response regulator
VTDQMAVRVVIVDDHRVFRSGVRAELAPAVADGRLDIVGEAGDVDEAVAVVAHTGRMSSCSTSICRAGRSVRAGARC